MDSESEAVKRPADPAALANIRDGAPERFVPGIMEGALIEVDHLSRYQWASQFAPGRRVLDVACGAGYGCVMLTEAGAKSVVGVDVSEGLIDAIRPQMPAQVQLQAGDIRSLDLPNGACELIVCFETIEHVERPREALAELARVLAADGLLIVSTPERRLSAENNPRHVHELTRTELESELAAHFVNVQVFQQEAFLSSAIGPDPGFTDEVGEAATVRKLTPAQDGLANYVIGLATRAELPSATPFLGVTTRLDFHTWQKFLDGAVEHTQQQQRRIDELGDLLLDHAELQDQLLDTEQRLLRLTKREQFEAELLDQDATRAEELRILRERIERADQVWRDVQASPSWRVTRPLRALKSLLKG